MGKSTYNFVKENKSEEGRSDLSGRLSAMEKEVGGAGIGGCVYVRL